MNNLTAQELIYKHMINEACESEEDIQNFVSGFSNCDELGQYEHMWEVLKSEINSDIFYCIEYENREGMETNLHPKTSSRHYEIDVHAMQVDDVWVAWDYYYGGGKHGEPEAFDWISNARIVECEEKVVTKIEYKFKEVLDLDNIVYAKI